MFGEHVCPLNISTLHVTSCVRVDLLTVFELFRCCKLSFYSVHGITFHLFIDFIDLTWLHVRADI